MSFKNNASFDNVDNSLEWGDWNEYDDEVLQDDSYSELSDMDDDFDKNIEESRIYVAGKFKNSFAPRPITKSFSKVDNKTDEEDDAKNENELVEYKKENQVKLVI